MSDPDFDELVGTDLEPGERARLERVHELLVAAGPPPELSPSRAGRAPPQRRRRGALLAIAAALAVAAFALGAARRGPAVAASTSWWRWTARAAAPEALGVARRSSISTRPATGRWSSPSRVSRRARAVARSSSGSRAGGELEALCGGFLTDADGSAVVPMNAPYRFDEFDGWVVVEEGSRRATPHDAEHARRRALSSATDHVDAAAVRGLRAPRASRRACRRATARAPGPSAFSATRCASTSSEGFPLVTTKKVHFKSIAVRAPLVPARRVERPLAAGARRHDLGRVGRRGRRSRPGVRRAVAELADARRRPRRPDRRGRPAPPRGPRLASDRRQRLERRRHPAHGARTVPRVLPVPRRGRAAVVPDLPAKRRRVPRRPVQHRELRAAHAHARAAVRPRGRRPRLDGRRLPHLRQPPRAGRDAARARSVPVSVAAAPPPARRRSSTTRSRTSRSSATSTIRRSARRSPCEGLARRRGRARRRDRARRQASRGASPRTSRASRSSRRDTPS